MKRFWKRNPPQGSIPGSLYDVRLRVEDASGHVSYKKIPKLLKKFEGRFFGGCFQDDLDEALRSSHDVSIALVEVTAEHPHVVWREVSSAGSLHKDYYLLSCLSATFVRSLFLLEKEPDGMKVVTEKRDDKQLVIQRQVVKCEMRKKENYKSSFYCYHRWYEGGLVFDPADPTEAEEAKRYHARLQREEREQKTEREALMREALVRAQKEEERAQHLERLMESISLEEEAQIAKERSLAAEERAQKAMEEAQEASVQAKRAADLAAEVARSRKV